jgi:NAD(P)H dehydrogenase (quinone)
MKKKILIVYAHPEPTSLTRHLVDVAVQTLQRQGHEVLLSDLYGMRWKAVFDEHDFPSRADPERLSLVTESGHSYASGQQAMDIASEQRKLLVADAVILQFPLWWFGMPAILKGWVDRVFSRGFAYSAGRKYERGHFKGKRAMLCITTGTASTLYEPDGIDGDLLHVLWPIHNGMLAYTGFAVLPPFVAWMPGRVDADERATYLTGYAARLAALDATEPLFFHPWDDYDESQRLKPGVVAKSGVQWNPGTPRD